MQGIWLIKCSPLQISRGQSYPRSEVLEPNHLDGNRMLVHLDIAGGYWAAHEPSEISSIMVQGRRRPTGRVVAEEPHIRSVGIELGLDMGGEIVASIDNHPDVCWVQPTLHDEIPGRRFCAIDTNQILAPIAAKVPPPPIYVHVRVL